MLWKLWDDVKDDILQEKLIKEAIEEKDYLYILGVREWKIPIHTYQVAVTTSTKIKIDIVKKMVMYACLNSPVHDLQYLSELLRVDPLFIEDIMEQMLQTGLVELNTTYTLTNIGKAQFEAGTFLSEPSTEEISFEYSMLNKVAIPEEITNRMIEEEWDDLSLYRYIKEDSLHNVILEEVTFREMIKQSGQVFEIGGSEKMISKISPLIFKNVKYAKCIEYQLYDLLDDQVYARVWNGALGRWDEQFEQEIIEKEGHIWQEKYHEDIIKHFPKRYEYLRTQLTNKTSKQQQRKLEILRGKSIRKRFIDAFKQTKRKMLMVSPWISASVLDKEMFLLLQQFAKDGKTLYISWGISKKIANEDRKPDPALIEKLKSIVHDDGTQAIFIRWFGNQHNKEIVIDDRTHLLGSFNWLSYRGDYDIRHESVVVVNDATVIQDATTHIEQKFIRALEWELNDILANGYYEKLLLENWMKELIILDSSLEKRQQLSNRLMNQLNEMPELKHALAILWAKYQTEDFGVRAYLAELLREKNFALANEYLGICQQYISPNLIEAWYDSPELQLYQKWLNDNLVLKKALPKNNAKRKKKV